MPSHLDNLILTDDGSVTCRDQESGELYHNRVGAYSEALHHYVEVCDLEDCLSQKNTISVLDVCFGLGYNTFVLLDKLMELIEQGKINQKIVSCNVTGIDKDPEILDILPEVLSGVRFEKLCSNFDLNKQVIGSMIESWKSGNTYKLQSKGKIELVVEIEIKLKDLRQFVLDLVRSGKHYDYIFHDGFSPRSMPELWTADLFKQYTKLITADGRIITYSSATAVRGGLTECGLAIRKSAPLGGKSGGTVAFHPESGEIADGECILQLNDDEKRRLKTRSAIPYRDATLSSSRTQILQCRAKEIGHSLLPIYNS